MDDDIASALAFFPGEVVVVLDVGNGNGRKRLLILTYSDFGCTAGKGICAIIKNWPVSVEAVARIVVMMFGDVDIGPGRESGQAGDQAQACAHHPPWNKRVFHPALP